MTFLPYPPLALLQRTGLVGDDRPEAAYDAIGAQIRVYIEDMLSADWDWREKTVLDFGCGAGRVLRQFADEARRGAFWGCDIDVPSIEWMKGNICPPFKAVICNEEPGMPFPGDTFDLIWSISVFTHLTQHATGWLLELRRVLKPGGLLLASFLGEAMIEPLLGETWDDDKIGFNAVLHGNGWDKGGPLTFISPWWIREHWGRAFDIVALRPYTARDQEGRPAGHGLVLLRKRSGRISAAEIDRIDPANERELSALQYNIKQLTAEIITLRRFLSSIEAERS